MQILKVLTLLSLILITCFSLSGAERSYLVKTSRIFDSTTGDYLLNQMILIQNGKIAKLGTKIIPPKEASIIDLTDYTVIPGLIDTHTHMLFSAKNFTEGFDQQLLSFYQDGRNRFRQKEAIKKANSFLLEGITSVRDLGNSGYFEDTKLKKLAQKENISIPRLFVSGPGIASRQGQFPIQAAQKYITQEYSILESPNAIKKLIKNYLQKGVDQIKVYAENSPGIGNLSLSILKTIVNEAKKYNLLVAAHAETDKALKRAIAAGVDSIEHGYEISLDSLKLMKKSKAFLIPTDLSRKTELLINTHRKKKLPLNYIEQVITSRQQRLSNAYKIGVPIAFGSDMYLDNIELGMPPGRLAKETLLAYHQSSIPSQVILQWATINAAQVIGQAHRLGIIKPNYLADLIAVQGDPIKDFKNINNVRFVMKGGVIYLNTTKQGNAR